MLISVTLAILLTIAAADVSHLVTPHHDINKQRLLKGIYETTIERHGVVELPTQIEIVKEGQPIYGVTHDLPSNNDNNNSHNKIIFNTRLSYLLPNEELKKQHLAQIAFEVPWKTYLAAGASDTIYAGMPTTNNNSLMKANGFQELLKTDMIMATTETPDDEKHSYVTTSVLPESTALPDSIYLAPSRLMLPPLPVELMPPTNSLQENL